MAQGDRTTTGKSFARRAPESVGITRFAEICPGLSRGGEPNETTLKYLHDNGYKTIVSFLPDPAESASVVQSGMKYVHIPMHSGPFSADPPTDEQVQQFRAVAGDTTQYPVFIHCHAGKDRTGAMSAIYRMQVCGWTRDEAIEEMKAFGFAGRYKKLFNYVYAYSPRKGANRTELATSASSSSPADSTSAQEAQTNP
jgi:protein tyrosine phosphatase (PTP) superfamily phosphohydrolase (DUF442 family)